jgi:predicted ATPase
MHLKKVVLLSHKYPTQEHHPFNLPVLRQTEEIVFDAPVTLLVGENGTGKSSLLEALARRCGIYIWEPMERSRVKYNPHEKQLFRFINVEWHNGIVPGSFFASQIFSHFSALLDEWAASDPGLLSYFGGESLMTQSHGESLMSFFRSRFKIKGLYLLDEPETALSAKTQLQLLKLLQVLSGQGHAQFIIATHSPILLACPGATIYSFDHVPVQRIEYEQTTHYQVYKGFLDNRDSHLTGT